MAVLLLIIIFLICAYVWWSHSRVASKVSASTPTLSGCLPVIGHALKFSRALDGVGALQLLDEASKDTNDNGKVMKGWIGPELFYVITDPGDALTLLNACLKKFYVYNYFEPFLGEGLFTARSVTLWQRHRKLLTPAFNQNVLDGFLDIFNQQSRCLVNKMAKEVDGGPFDHWPYLAFNGLETICRTALGVPESGEDLVGKEYAKVCRSMARMVISRTIKFWLGWNCIFKWSPLKTEQDEAVKVFHKLSNDVMEKSKPRIQDEGKDDNKSRRFKPFMDLLLELAAGGALSYREIREEVDTMIISGFDTSSTTILFTLILLGSYTEVQNQVYDELLKVFGTSDRDVTKEDLPKLVYLEAVLKESLRLYPAGPVLFRHADKDVTLKNCTVASGAAVIVSIWGIHRNEQIWGQDVDKFRPERWLEGGHAPAGAFAAFSLGRRGCIGKTYALMSMKTTLVHLLRRYRFSSDLDDLTLQVKTTLSRHSGGNVSIELR